MQKTAQTIRQVTKKLCLGIVLVFLTISTAFGLPIADGRFDPAEGYMTGYNVGFSIEGGGSATGGELWIYQNPATFDVTVAFIQPLDLIDNTYGENSVGWGKGVAPSGKGHKFKDLAGSDKAQFVFTDLTGNVVLDVYMDYISGSHGTYQSLGVTGGDGKVRTGSAASVTAFGTSLDYNFNVLDYRFFVDSPATDSNYSDPLSAPGWIFPVIYEIQVDGSLFSSAGFGGVAVPVVHDSPNKLGKKKVYPYINGPIRQVPEPSTAILVGAGLVFLAGFRRKRTRTREG